MVGLTSSTTKQQQQQQQQQINDGDSIAGDCCFITACINLCLAGLGDDSEDDCKLTDKHQVNTKKQTMAKLQDDQRQVRCKHNRETKRHPATSTSTSTITTTTTHTQYHHSKSKLKSGGQDLGISRNRHQYNNSKRNAPRNRILRHRTTPPGVIALSRSDCSSNSDSSSSSSLSSSYHYRNKGSGRGRGRGSRGDTASTNYSLHASSDDPSYTYDRNYAAQHEQLINSLFEDAKRRQELHIQDELEHTIGTNTPSTSGLTDDHDPSSTSNSTFAYHTPPRKTHSSDRSVTSRNSKYSRSSSVKSHGSELLTPSSHRYSATFDSPRGFSRLRRRRYFKKRSGKDKHKNQSSSRSVGTSSILNHNNGRSPSPNPCDYSACDGSMTTSSPCHNTSVKSFLDENVRLQKDSGRGSELGSSISANGLEDSLYKLNEKIDVLAEVDREGKWAHAVLTRIPAKDVTRERRENGHARQQHHQDYVETRSMLAVKLGFVSLKYGVLVHWNIHTNLAEFILLRKSCPESFMRAGSPAGKKKGKQWRKKKFRMSDAAIRTTDKSFLVTPSFVTVSSVQSEHSYGSLGLDPVASAPL